MRGGEVGVDTGCGGLLEAFAKASASKRDRSLVLEADQASVDNYEGFGFLLNLSSLVSRS